MRTFHRDLFSARLATLGPVVLAFPFGIIAVFALGADRKATADVIAWIYSVGLFFAFTTSFWPLPSLEKWGTQRRAQSAVLLFLVVSYVTHLSWELGWLLVRDRMESLRHVPWGYLWWAYIDGGDMRYAVAPADLVTIEILSVINGCVGITGLALWVRSKGKDRHAVLLFMATAVVHLYSSSYYFLTEILAGMPNVDTSSSTDSWIKFGLANSPWITMPWIVLWWGAKLLRNESAD